MNKNQSLLDINQNFKNMKTKKKLAKFFTILTSITFLICIGIIVYGFFNIKNSANDLVYLFSYLTISTLLFAISLLFRSYYILKIEAHRKFIEFNRQRNWQKVIIMN